MLKGKTKMQDTKFTYHVHWSDEDQQFVGTVDQFPLLSYCADTEHDARRGIERTVDYANDILNHKLHK